MRELLATPFRIMFPVRKSASNGERRTLSPKYVFLLAVFPLLSGGFAWLAACSFGISLHDPGVVAESFGVLGGLLFAHAIFVFQLRISYDANNSESDKASDAPQRDLRVRPKIDEMFSGVLYASLVALALTVLTSGLAAALDDSEPAHDAFFVVIVTLGAHLIGCIYHVLVSTTSAYGKLKERRP